jgi:ABC-type xylose transport system permease subunit
MQAIAESADATCMIDQLLSRPESQLVVVAAVAAGVVLLLGAVLGYVIGRRKSRPVLGVVLGGLLTVPGLIALALVPRKEPAYY